MEGIDFVLLMLEENDRSRGETGLQSDSAFCVEDNVPDAESTHRRKFFALARPWYSHRQAPKRRSSQELSARGVIELPWYKTRLDWDKREKKKYELQTPAEQRHPSTVGATAITSYESRGTESLPSLASPVDLCMYGVGSMIIKR